MITSKRMCSVHELTDQNMFCFSARATVKNCPRGPSYVLMSLPSLTDACPPPLACPPLSLGCPYPQRRFRSKYHPDEAGRRRAEAHSALQNRLNVYTFLMENGWFDNVSLDIDRGPAIVKVLDAGRGALWRCGLGLVFSRMVSPGWRWSLPG